MKIHSRSQNAPVAGHRIRRTSAFTLIELMIAVTIVLILTVMTVAVVNVTINRDRVPGTARQIQSFLEGARNRAIYSTRTLNPGPRGVRFLFDPNSPTMKIRVPAPTQMDPNATVIRNVPTTITGMTYIGPPTTFKGEGLIISDTANDKRALSNLPIEWSILTKRQFVRNGTRIRIPDNSDTFYTIIFDRDPDNPTVNVWQLTRDYEGPSPASFSLELEPAVLPNQEPRLFMPGVVIDIYRQEGDVSPAPPANPDNIPDDQNLNNLIDPNHSRLPFSWYQYRNRNRMDILFSPRGTVVGRAASVGYIHLVVREMVDLDEARVPGHADIEGSETIVTVNTRTGAVTSSHVDPTDMDNNGVPDDPFRFAESGEISQ